MANSKKSENEVRRTGLYWSGKRTEVERVALRFRPGRAIRGYAKINIATLHYALLGAGLPCGERLL